MSGVRGIVLDMEGVLHVGWSPIAGSAAAVAELAAGGIELGVLTLEEKPADADTLNAIFRALHTFKGGSGFLNLLPISKHFHIITGLPNVFFGKLEPTGALAKQDLETATVFGSFETFSVIASVLPSRDTEICAVPMPTARTSPG